MKNNQKKVSSENKNYSLPLLVLISTLATSVGPILILIIYEFIRFPNGLFMKEDPILLVFAVSIFAALAFVGLIVSNIVCPIEALVENIKNYKNNKITPLLNQITRVKEFTYLFDEFSSLIMDVEKYQKDLIEKHHQDLIEKTRLAAIGTTTAMVAHDIRKPLMYINALLRMIPDIGEKQQEIRKIISQTEISIERISKMLDEILDFSSTKEISLSEYNLITIIQQACSEILRCYPKADVEMAYDFNHDHINILADSNRLINVITNLMSNSLDAAKNSSVQKTRLFFSTHIIHDNNEKFVILTLRDNGSGIPEKYLKEIFNPFFSHGKINGIGLGLAICKKNMLLHGGDISIKNNSDKGVEAFVKLKAGKKQAKQINDNLIYSSKEFSRVKATDGFLSFENLALFLQINKAKSRKSTLLIIDDESVFTENILAELSSIDGVKDHMETYRALGYDDAMKILNSHVIDYAIIDMDLGIHNLSGDKIALEILSHFNEVHVVICSNKNINMINFTPLKQYKKFLGAIRKPMKSSELLQLFACKVFHDSKKSEDFENKKETILLLNDDVSTRCMISLDLEELGFNVIEAATCEQALFVYKEEKIACIISDISLGKNQPSGYDFLEKIKHFNQSPPFVFISGYSQKEQGLKNADAYIQLPYQITHLKKTIYHLLNR